MRGADRPPAAIAGRFLPHRAHLFAAEPSVWLSLSPLGPLAHFARQARVPDRLLFSDAADSCPVKNAVTLPTLQRNCGTLSAVGVFDPRRESRDNKLAPVTHGSTLTPATYLLLVSGPPGDNSASAPLQRSLLLCSVPDTFPFPARQGSAGLVPGPRGVSKLVN